MIQMTWKKKKVEKELPSIIVGRIQQKNASCFFAHSISKDYNEIEAKIERQRFYDDIINFPDYEHPHTLTDYILQRYFYYKDGVVRCTPLITSLSVDKAIVIKVAKQIDEEYKEYRKQLYVAYILQLLHEEQLGIGYKTMSLDEFVEFIKDYKAVNRANIHKYLPGIKAKYPQWKVTDKNDDIDPIKTISANEYGQLFLSKYSTLYAEIYDKEGISLSKLKEILML